MTPMSIILVAVAVVIVAGVVWAMTSRERTRSLRTRFGPEYDREVREHGSRRRAEAELARRTRRVDHLEIHPMPPAERARYAERWSQAQARFVDDPRGAVSDADRLVEEVMARRGYPMGSFEQRSADISVNHARVVENYRAAHDIALRVERDQAGTEDLRTAMIHYRELFEDLLEERPVEVYSR